MHDKLPIKPGSYKCCSLEALKRLETDVAHDIEQRQKSFVEHISGFFEKLFHKQPENPEPETCEKKVEISDKAEKVETNRPRLGLWSSGLRSLSDERSRWGFLGGRKREHWR